MEKIISSKRLTPLFALICAFLWGCGFSVTKTGYSLFAVGSVPDKILFAGIRFILAGVMTLICRISTGKIDLKAVRTSFTKIVLLSMFQTVFQYAFLYIALSELSGSASSVLNQLGSFLLALLLPLTDRNERMSAGKIAGSYLHVRLQSDIFLATGFPNRSIRSPRPGASSFLEESSSLSPEFSPADRFRRNLRRRSEYCFISRFR